MANKFQSEELADRIAELETKIEAKVEAIEQGEKDVSAAYGGNGDPKAATEKLQRDRSDLQVMADAVRDLDRQLVETSYRDNEQARAALEREAHDTYRKVMKDVRSALGKLDGNLAKTLPKDKASAMAREVDELARHTAWVHANSLFSEMYLERVPKPVRGVPHRDENGMRNDAPVGVGQYGRAAS